MLFSPEVAFLIHQIFMFFFALSVGYFLTGLLFPLSEIPSVIPPGPALPAGLILVFVYAAAIGALESFVPMPTQYTLVNVNNVINTLLFLCVYGVGNALGSWMPLVKIESKKEKS